MKTISKQQALQELRKKFWLRSTIFSFIIGIAILVDEYVKEGYWFKPSDINVIGAHESLTLIAFGVTLISLYMHIKKNGGGKG